MKLGVAGFAHTASTLFIGLFGRLNVSDNDSGARLLSFKLNFVPGFDLVQHRNIFDAEHHGHAGHVQVFNRTMFQGDFFVFLVDLAHFAVSHVCCCR